MDLLAVDFFAVDFLAVDFLAGLLFLAVDFFAVDFLAVDFLAGLLFLAVDFFAVDFFAVDFLAVDFLAALLFFAVDFFAVDFLPVDFVAFFAVFFAAEPAFLAVAVAFLAAGPAAATVSLGSCLAPETTFLSSAPAVNFGTDVALAWICSPVRGFRTIRALRIFLSKDPNPVMATLFPLATSRVIVSSTDSSAWAAALRFPSNRSASASTS